MTSGSVITAPPAASSPPPGDAPHAPWSERGRRYLENALFALLVYVPILLMSPGQVESDTKSYLYLDPGRLLSTARSLWTPRVGMGGMSHQTIGYLFPMGPYYWVLDRLAVPDWVSQRLWLGTIVFLAGLGIRYLLRTLGVRGVGVPIAMVAYAFTPYVLGNSAQYTVLLGPWAAMPWWIAFMVLGLRRGGWKYPALFALSVQLVAALNGSALIFGLVAPAMWLLYAWLVTRESTLRRVWTLVWRTGLLTAVTALWWVVALSVESKYGLNILRFTESIQVVSMASHPAEILRGLGNWFFYGSDRAGLWSDARPFYTQRFWLIFVSFLIPTLALASAAVVRWKYKAYFAVVVLVGMAIAVGPTPYDDPSIAGGIFKDLALKSQTFFALRNTVRAVPMVALGLSVLLGIGANALVATFRRTQWRPYAYAMAGLVMVLVLVNSIPALAGNYYNQAMERDPDIPQYWQQAIRYLDSQSHQTRVLSLPGTPFATYRWGDMKDAVEPGLMDRPYVDRELVPVGTEPAANLVQSLDQRLQEQYLDPDAIAPVARLMGVGDVELRMDLRTDQYGLIPAGQLWKVFTEPVPAGLGAPKTFGRRIPGRLEFPETGDLSQPGPKPKAPKPVAVLAVEDPLPITRAKDSSAPIVIAGDGAGIVDTASAGLLDSNRLVLYSAPFEKKPGELRKVAPDATLVITDSNRRRATRWSAMTDDFGYTEQAGEQPLVDDPLDQRLEPFPETGDATRTVTELRGVKSLRASSYGSSTYQYAPRIRPTQAMDGDIDTAWLTAAGEPVGDARLRIEFDHPITTDRLNLAQVSRVLGAGEPRDPRWITRIGLTFDDGATVVRRLSQTSRRDAGETVEFPRRTFETLEIKVEGVHGNERRSASAMNPIGINELRIADGNGSPIRVTEAQRLPTDLLAAFGARSADHPLAVVLTAEPSTDNAAMSRVFTLPSTRRFEIVGKVEIGNDDDDDAIDRALGLPDASQGGVTATSSDRFGPARSRASSALDGDPATAWVAPVAEKKPSMTIEVPAPITVDHLDLRVVADGRHSVPTRLTVTNENGDSRVAELPVVAPNSPGGTAAAPVTFAPLTGRTFQVTMSGAKVVRQKHDELPAGIAELGMPGVRRAPLPASLADRCIDDLVQIDGKPFPVRLTGSPAAALQDRGSFTLTPCDAGTTVALDAGHHEVTAPAAVVSKLGLQATRLVLSSAAGGGATPAARVVPASTAEASPRTRVVDQGSTFTKVRVDDATKPFWLVLGQSYNAGWEVTVDGRTLGAPTLVDGYANGWRVNPKGSGPMTISIRWAPEQSFDRALVVSLLATIGCLGIVLGAAIRRRRRRRRDGEPVNAGADPLAEGAPAAPGIRMRLLTEPLAHRTGATVATVAIAGVVAAVLVRPWVGLVVALAVLLAIRSPKWRLALRVVPVLLVLGVAVYVTVEQRLNRYPAGFSWPTRFSAASIPVWIAVMLLAADALISMVWSARAAPGAPPSVAPSVPEPDAPEPAATS